MRTPEVTSVSEYWNKLLALGPSTAGVDRDEDCLRTVLTEARALPGKFPGQRLALLTLGSHKPVSELPFTLTEPSDDPLSALERARELLTSLKVDTVAIQFQSGSNSVCLALRRFRAAWRAKLRIYAVLREEAFPDNDVTMHFAVGAHRGIKKSPGVCLLEPVSQDLERQMLSLAKMVLALHDRLLPPTESEHDSPDTPYYLCRQTRPWFHGNDLTPRRAIWSSEGRESYWEESPGGLLDPDFKRLATAWSSEVFIISAPSLPALYERMDALENESLQKVRPADLARGLAEAPLEKFRLALIASDSEKLRSLLAKARKRLERSAEERFSLTSGIYYGVKSEETGGVAFVFPGQGSQYPNMLMELAICFPQMQSLFDRFDEECHPGFPRSSEFLFPIEGAPRAKDAQQTLMDEEGAEAITLGAQACYAMWRRFGLTPDLIVGYSIGELSALIAAEILPIQRMDVAGLMSELTRSRTPGGRSQFPSIAVSGAPRELVNRLIEEAEEPLYLALDSCPSQIVMAGHQQPIEHAVEVLRAAGATVVKLRFDRGYHTPLYERKARRLRGLYDGLNLQPGRLPVFSCISLDYFPQEVEAIKELALSQWTNPVRFTEAVCKLHDHGVRTFVEVGAGSRLTGFVRDCLRGRSYLALASDAQGRGLKQLQQSFCSLLSWGHDLDPKVFFSGREVTLPESFVEKECPQAMVGAAPIAPSSPTPADQRVQILQGHMQLMNEFLAQQSRLHSRLTGAPLPEVVTATATLEPPAVEVEEWAKLPFLTQEPTREGERLIWHLEWSTESLPLLQQHTLGNRCSERDSSLHALGVVPFAFVAEVMAEAAAYAMNALHLTRLSDIRALRWLAADRGKLAVRVEVEPAGASWKVQVSEDLEAGPALAYSCRVEGAPELPPSPAPQASLESLQIDLHHSEALFYEYAFHGKNLQGIERFHGYTSEGAEMDMLVPEWMDLLGGVSAPQFLLNPALLDSMGQSVGYWLLESLNKRDIGLYPFRIGSYERFSEAAGCGERLQCRARMEFDGQRTRASFDLINAGGSLTARVTGAESLFFSLDHDFFRYLFNIDYQSYLSRVEHRADGLTIRILDSLEPSLLEQSGGIWRRGLAHMSLSKRERDVWNELPEKEKTSALLRRLVVKELLRDWASTEFLPTDIDCGVDGVTPGGVSFALLKPFPRLAVASVETESCGVAVESDCALGISFLMEGIREAALSAWYEARPDLRGREVSVSERSKDTIDLSCEGIAAVVKIYEVGDRAVAVCRCPAREG